ncbi:hypothetical protein [uncultured Tateyamaria sp.]|uniref:hypothetical protein n=1 Tax=Tateyamaria sp. 1078 TaxID=3417464 RepID=UPI00262D6F72|nr:hypothetical protein [uncultured Tateyamaria sp.]
MGKAAKQDEVLATVHSSAGRRILGVGSIWVLAVLVLYVAVVNPPEPGWQVFLFVVGGGAIWMAEKMRRATSHAIELTRSELRDTRGMVLAPVDQIVSVDRGMFAFKPSNGFLLKLSHKAPRSWHPGMWWRMGARIGVGGMTPGHQAKFMAEMISAMIAERDGV